MNNKALYKPLDYFLIRSPLLPIDIYYEKISKINQLDDLLLQYQSSLIIQEAVLIANPKLYSLIEKINRVNERSKNQILNTLFRYLIRLTSRATPFGLFASSGLGHFEKITNIIPPTASSLIRHLRPDMTWVFQMIKKIDKDFSVIRKLKIKAHNALVISGNRVFHHGFYDFEKKFYKVISIENSPVVDFILTYSKEWRPYENLENLLLEKFEDLDKKALKNFLEEIYSNQFIVSELNIDLLTNCPANQFLDKLFDLQLITQHQHQNIPSLVSLYNSEESNKIFKIRESLSSLLENQILEDNNYIQVDCSFPNANQILHQSISVEAAKAGDFLYKWSVHQSKKRIIDIYHEEFLEKFGSEKAIPFLDLIDEHLGIGIPNFFKDLSDSSISLWEKNILNKCQQAIFHGEKEVVITEEELENFSNHNNSNNIPPVSAAIFCKILAEDSLSINKGEFSLILSSLQVVPGATSCIGRFSHILPTLNDKILNTNKKESQLEKGSVFVELSWLPHQGKLGNVAIHDCFRDFSLKIPLESPANHTNILLSDLYVGSNSEYLFLFSKNLNKRIILSSNNVLNSELAPPFVHLLNQISQSSSEQINSFSLQSEYFPYLPRIKYSKTYLAPATWNIHLDYFTKQDVSSITSIRIKLQEWMEKWSVPKYVYINPNYSDQILLLDRENIIHLDQIIKILKEQRQISIYEKLALKTCKWAQENNKTYLCEFIIPIIRSNVNNFIFPSFTNSNPTKRKDSNEEKWIYLKLFCSFERQNDLLINHILPLMQTVNYQNWFFVRYNDPKDHIRLRIKPNIESFHTIYQYIESWSLALTKAGYICNFSFHPYCPEVERYGGLKLFQKAENLFSADSLTAISILHLSLSTTTSLISLAALGIIDLLLTFNYSLTESFLFLEDNNNKISNIDGFRKHKLFLVKGIQNLRNKNSGNTQKKLYNFIDAFEYRVQAIQDYQEKASLLKDVSNIRKDTIVNSFIHMFCNRLGISPVDEKKVRFYAYKAISAQIMLEQNKDPSLSH